MRLREGGEGGEEGAEGKGGGGGEERVTDCPRRGPTSHFAIMRLRHHRTPYQTRFIGCGDDGKQDARPRYR